MTGVRTRLYVDTKVTRKYRNKKTENKIEKETNRRNVNGHTTEIVSTKVRKSKGTKKERDQKKPK
jgi:hypothetical protein